MKAVILAGGGGTRLWPVSRQKEPKQVKPFLDNDTLLQKAYKRVRLFLEPEDIYISTNVDLKDYIKEQIPDMDDSQIILEPAKKDTEGGQPSLLRYLCSPRVRSRLSARLCRGGKDCRGLTFTIRRRIHPRFGGRTPKGMGGPV